MQGMPHIEVGGTAVIKISWPRVYDGVLVPPQFHLAKYDLDAWTPQWLRPIDVERRNDDAAFLAVQLNEVGAYKLEALAGGFRPIRFLVTDSGLHTELSAGTPQPLSVTIRIGDECRTLGAFADTGPCELTAAPRCAVTVQMHVHAAARIYYERQDSGGKRLRREGPVNEVQAAMEADLQACVDADRRCSFVLDAGAFGRLSAAVSPQRAESRGAAAPAVLSPHAVQRARWLAQAIRAQQHGRAQGGIIVPHAVRQRLQVLEVEYPALCRLTFVPRGLWPHLLRLVHDLPVNP